MQQLSDREMSFKYLVLNKIFHFDLFSMNFPFATKYTTEKLIAK